MGIVNASPESFFDGHEVGSTEDQIARALAMHDDGADLIDVGGESGVTDLPAVTAQEELERVLPIVERLAAEDAIVSIDTWKPEVARGALEAGAAMVNDVSGLADPGVAEACAETGAGLILTHTRAAPKQKSFPSYPDVVEDVVERLRERMEAARALGMHAEQLVLDPGPDLAKTPADTITVLRALPRLAGLGRPVLLAASRKDFVGALTGRSPRDRLAGTLAAIGVGLDLGASILRVHDVPATLDYLAVRAALRGERDVDPDLRLDPGLRRVV
ncbi:MAG: dihydropteroate synthase [Actinobacteria bacterium]|nr:MAG: dihydropteroate synthase [Actinomycetota bacterium]